MISDIFYFFGILISWLNIDSIIMYFKSIKSKEWVFKYKEYTGEDIGGKIDHNMIKKYDLVSDISIYWMMISLVTSDLMFTIPVLILNKIDIYFSKKYTRISKITGFIIKIITSIVIFLLSIRHFHKFISY